MTSRAYRARYRGYRDFGLISAGVAVLLGVASWLLEPSWVAYVPMAWCALATFAAASALLGYYVTGFSE